MKCCRFLVNGVDEALPFERVIAIGYYDGPTEGFTACSQCGQGYSFYMMDWDDKQDVRVFGLSPLDITLDAIETRLGLRVDGRYRVSIVPPLAESENAYVGSLLRRIPTHVTVVKGWPGRSSVWLHISRLDVKNITDWLAFLGIRRKGVR